MRRVATITMASALVGAACSVSTPAEPTDAGEIRIELRDYDFDPGTIRLTAGETVRLVLVNEGRHAHEFMAGRDPVFNQDYLEQPVAEPFRVDFFEGIDVQVTGEGMAMNFSGMEEMDMDGEMDMGEGGTSTTMADHDDEHADDHGDEMDMDGEMDMGEGGTSTTMADHDDEHADDHGDEMDMDGEMDMGHEEGEEAHHGGMVMLQPGPGPTEPGQASVITFTVPEDKVGTWEFGCFEEEGQHFEDGMRGTLIVEEA